MLMNNFLFMLLFINVKADLKLEQLKDYGIMQSPVTTDPPLNAYIPVSGSESQIKNDQNNFHFRVTSTRDQVYVERDSEVIINLYDLNQNVIDFRNSSNGLHCIIFQPKSGRVISRRVFNTELFAESIGIHPMLASYTRQEIFVFAIKFDAGLNLSKDIRRVFLNMGSMIIHNVVYRSYFVWIFTRGGKTYLESFINDNAGELGDYITSPVHVDVFVPKTTEVSCWDLTNNFANLNEENRAYFCRNYGGYGSLCDCSSPLDIQLPPIEMENNVINNVPILIIASNRPQALYRCIITILTQPGGKKENILVSIDGHNKQVEELLLIFQIKFLVNNHKNFYGKGSRICDHYKFSLSSCFRRFPQSQFVIVLEEDILAAPDFLSYFNQTANILLKDPSLYCSCAWNDLSAMHTGGDARKVLRMETQPSYGWMITKDFYKEVELYWIASEKNYDWDIWFRGPWVRASRECLIPEVSRSFHMGESGVHIRGQMTYSQFVGHLTTNKQNIRLDQLDRLGEQEYEEDLYSLLESDKVVFMNSTSHPCNENFIPKNFTKKVIVIFISMESGQDNQAWSRLSSCLGVFDMDTRNHHRGLFRFRFFETQVFAIGYPFSDYSYLKPSFVNPISPLKSKWDNEYLGKLSLLNRIRFRVPHQEKYLPHPLLLESPNPAPNYVRKVLYA